MAGFPHIFSLTFVADIVTMSIEGERGTENPSQVPPCATGWPVRMVFSTIAFNRKRGHLCGLRCSRVVQLRPRESFFLLTFYFSFDTIITELIEKQPIDAYDLVMTETTIGRGDAPTLPPSGLWSSELGIR